MNDRPLRSRLWSWLGLALALAVGLRVIWDLLAPIIVPLTVIAAGGGVGAWLLGRRGGYR